LARLFNTDEKLSYYLHSLASHGGEFMETLGSLGRYMNEGMEHHHKLTWSLYEHTFKGGTAGSPWQCKLENSNKADRSKGKHDITGTSITRDVLKRQSRVFFHQNYKTWDESVFTTVGLKAPQPGDDVYQCLKDQSKGVRETLALYASRKQARRAEIKATEAASTQEGSP
jgi:hypothetical protein